MAEVPTIHFIVERDEVRACDTARMKECLSKLIESEATARSHFQNIILSFNGFDDDPEEVYENDFARAYVQKLDRDFPFWLYFLDPCYSTFYAIAMCFVPPYLTDEARAEIHPLRLAQLFEKRWLPALCQIGQWTGMSQAEVDMLAIRWGDYFKGPLKPPIVN